MVLAFLRRSLKFLARSSALVLLDIVLLVVGAILVALMAMALLIALVVFVFFDVFLIPAEEPQDTEGPTDGG